MADAMCVGCGETDPNKACVGCLHFASPPAREEAPAEGAGEIEGLRNRIKCLEKLAGEQSLRVMQEATRAKDAENELAALRNRTSEPEAGAVETLGPSAGFWSNVITHPAPATADKLKGAVEGLRLAKERIQSWPIDDHETCMCGSLVEGHDIGSGHSPVSQADHAISTIVQEIDQALAALNEQPQ